MPHYCIVPMCKNHSGMQGISFHRLPLSSPQVLKQWICKIRRESVPLNKYSRVCSVHFAGGKKDGPNDVPTIFAWTPATQAPPKPRECANELADVSISTTHLDDNSEIVDQHTYDVATITDPLYTESVSTNTDLLGEDVGTQTACTVVDDAQTQTVRQICHVGIQLSLHSDHKET